MRSNDSAQAFTLVPFDDENDEPSYELSHQAHALARRRDIGITRDRRLCALAMGEPGEVIGALWVSFTQDNFEFDIAVSKAHERRGVGAALLDLALSERSDCLDVDPDSTMLVHVVSPQMKSMLQRRGFVITQILGSNNFIMQLRDEHEAQPLAQYGDDGSSFGF